MPITPKNCSDAVSQVRRLLNRLIVDRAVWHRRQLSTALTSGRVMVEQSYLLLRLRATTAPRSKLISRRLIAHVGNHQISLSRHRLHRIDKPGKLTRWGNRQPAIEAKHQTENELGSPVKSPTAVGRTTARFSRSITAQRCKNSE
jgi:hypothetical protein